MAWPPSYMIPKPRNYQMGIFKFTSTSYGSKPLREDLIRTVRRGVRGTSMPAFPLLPPKDLEAVVDYVIALTRRGELENKLADQAEFDEQIDEAKLPDVVKEIVTRWDAARGNVVYPTTPMPTFKRSNIDQGKQAFLTIGCAKCHGEDGRGMMASNVGTDAWGNPTKAADLTSGMLRGGTEPLDIYRHIDAGINGTPMPSFRDTLKNEPATIWNLVSYVLQVADIRREGSIPDSGFLEDAPAQDASRREAGFVGTGERRPHRHRPRHNPSRGRAGPPLLPSADRAANEFPRPKCHRFAQSHEGFNGNRPGSQVAGTRSAQAQG